MLEVAVYNMEGQQVDKLEVDEAVFGGEVNASLLKQAVVAYHTNLHICSAKTKGRADVEGSTRKLFRQKGTGNARRGQLRTHKVRGGGVAFHKRPDKVRHKLSQKARKAALNSAILAKLLGNDLMVLDGLSLDAPRTRTMADAMRKLSINRSCLLTTRQRDHNVHLSCRNLQDLTVRTADELNAYDVAMRRKMLVTRDAMRNLMGEEA